jgi:anti-anti-sigma factor
MNATKSLLQAEIVQLQQAVVLKLRGEIRLDAREAEVQFNRLAAARSPLTIIEMSELTFLSSLGMGLLVALNTGLARVGGKLRLAAVRPDVVEALGRTALLRVLHIFPDVDAAIAG